VSFEVVLSVRKYQTMTDMYGNTTGGYVTETLRLSPSQTTGTAAGGDIFAKLQGDFAPWSDNPVLSEKYLFVPSSPSTHPRVVAGTNTTRHDTHDTHDTTRHDATRHDTTRHDTTRHDTTRHDTTRHDTTRHDTTRHARTIDTTQLDVETLPTTQERTTGCCWTARARISRASPATRSE
jgi:hypothetical protein